MSGDEGTRRLADRMVDGLATADGEEAAAVAVAIGAYLRDREQAAASATAEDDESAAGWPGRKWAFAERLDRNDRAAVRITDSSPSDPWTAAGRTERL